MLALPLETVRASWGCGLGLTVVLCVWLGLSCHSAGAFPPGGPNLWCLPLCHTGPGLALRSQGLASAPHGRAVLTPRSFSAPQV